MYNPPRMKRIILTLSILSAVCAFAYAGPEPLSGDAKEMKETVAPVPPCDWYRSNEWNVSIWGAYAFPSNDGRYDLDAIAAEHEITEANEVHEDNIAQLSKDLFLNDDSAFGGGAEFKYFFHRYLGIGVEGFALDARNTVGGVLGTFTVRFPIGCSRWAPYVFGGGGVVFGGSQDVVAEIEEDEFFYSRQIDEDDAVLDAQVGGGLECRFTRRIGIMADFSWHFLDGPENNFGMVRSGVNFAF